MCLEIKLLNSKTIKLSLSIKDMKKYNITDEILQNDEELIKNLTLNLLENIKNSISAYSMNNKIFIESFKTKENGCLLYVSITQKSTNQKQEKTTSITPIIAIFNTKRNMQHFCKNINTLYMNENLNSELYSFADKFILIIFVPDNEKKQFLSLIKEFGKIYGKGNVKYIIVKEHCKPIWKKNALENILKLNIK